MAFRAITANVEGGSALARHLAEIEKRLGRGAHVRVGFLASATYPAGDDSENAGLHVAQVAAWNEWGTATSPERPFFRDMVEKRSPRWGVQLGNILRKNDYETEKSLGLMGEVVKGQLVQSINNWSSPANAARTVAKKGFNKPLIDTGVMLRSVDYQVISGEDVGDD
jgi:hypothetical protein